MIDAGSYPKEESMPTLFKYVDRDLQRMLLSSFVAQLLLRWLRNRKKADPL